MHFVELVLIFFGAISLFKLFLTICNGFYGTFFRPGKNLKKIGSWAVITGATDGIGKGFAFELAKKGLNIFLISRSNEKLEAVRQELLNQYKSIQVKTLSIDFSAFDQSAQSSVAEMVKTMDVAVLINNVGASYSFPKFFDELTHDEVDYLIQLNILSTTWMTYLVLPGMKQRKKGAIVNISSAAGLITSPLLSGYAGCKSYVKAFSASLSAELEKFNISVQCQAPLFVTTKLSKIRKSSLFIPSPKSYARAGVAAIGYESVISPFWAHRLQLFIISLLPNFLLEKYVFNTHQSLRRRGLKKESEKQKAN